MGQSERAGERWIGSSPRETAWQAESSVAVAVTYGGHGEYYIETVCGRQESECGCECERNWAKK